MPPPSIPENWRASGPRVPSYPLHSSSRPQGQAAVSPSVLETPGRGRGHHLSYPENCNLQARRTGSWARREHPDPTHAHDSHTVSMQTHTMDMLTCTHKTRPFRSAWTL